MEGKCVLLHYLLLSKIIINAIYCHLVLFCLLLYRTFNFNKYWNVKVSPMSMLNGPFVFQLIFMPDGTLVIFTGDGGIAGDPFDYGQDL